MGLNKRLYEEKQNRKVKYNRMPDNRWPLDVTIEGDTGMTQQWERQQDTKAVALFNKKIRAWGAKVDSALRTSIGIHIEEDKELSKSLKQNYRHFGKSLPHSSYAQRNVGRRVSSLSKAKPGDIICYSGHVAIYMGNNRVIHASNPRDGIKITKGAAYRSIVTIRRIF